jgi:ribosomal protein L29
MPSRSTSRNPGLMRLQQRYVARILTIQTQ